MMVHVGIVRVHVGVQSSRARVVEGRHGMRILVVVVQLMVVVVWHLRSP